MFSRITRSLSHRALQIASRISTIAYWRLRAWLYGRQAVLHVGHSTAEYDAVTARQRDVLFPLLKSQLTGGERLLIDFGCGPGRFTRDLAKLTGADAMGVDPVKSLLNEAPAGPNTSFRVMRNHRIPVDDETVDVVWVCIVLGGIVGEEAGRRAAGEIERCLKRDGLLFLVENTASAPDSRHWCFRSEEELARLFPRIPLKKIGQYDDLGQSISVMAGRKC